ncbi:endonuclease III [Paraliomyxa miuraensis]|uniref:endonuclease III n=1 Tax=Paraliomyxa miuraensis TaxID=376150 RepID=UPI00225150E7|nr:endonuclease III [Paraliomyxa miuraensis]MCX4245489.1 endonuclease III [Paraliomyxa miuraensis]
MDRAPIQEVEQRLRVLHPDARYELDFETPFHLLVATILAARCTDERVNKVTKTLFAKYPDPQSMADAQLEDLEEDVRPTGSYKTKAKAIQGAARELLVRFGGQVPQTMAEMTTLPGVARKTANVVLNMAFGIPSGIIVDTHVARVGQRMGLTRHDKAERIEEDLMRALPKDDWTHFGPAMVLLGRYVCKARAPQCAECPMDDICPKRPV